MEKKETNYRQEQVLLAIRNAWENQSLSEEIIWDALLAYEHHLFYTSKGIEYSYEIHGYEMVVNRKKKTITKSTVMLSVRKVQELNAIREPVTGPKKIGTFGASYLFPIFKEWGLI